MANNKIGYVLYVLIDDDVLPLYGLSTKQKEELQQNITQRLSKNLSDYFTQHPEEYKQLPKKCIVFDEKEDAH